jgi:hypothetical protein
LDSSFYHCWGGNNNRALSLGAMYMTNPCEVCGGLIVYDTHGCRCSVCGRPDSVFGNGSTEVAQLKAENEWLRDMVKAAYIEALGDPAEPWWFLHTISASKHICTECGAICRFETYESDPKSSHFPGCSWYSDTDRPPEKAWRESQAYKALEGE